MIDHGDSAPAIPVDEASMTDVGSYVFRDEAILGTRMQIHLVARNFADAQAAAISARHEIDRLNGIFNSRDPESELSILNRSQVHHASVELFEVVALAERWRAESDGAFSGRLGKLIRMWDEAGRLPPARAELSSRARDIESAHVGLNPATREVEHAAAVEFALDAIAKGWIVDRAFAIAVASPGVTGALVNIGGDIRCGGRAPDSKGWCIGIPNSRVDADNAPLTAAVYLSAESIATSGRGPRDRIFGDDRFSPTLSPRDGWPVNHAMTVTAIGSTAAEADLFATTLMALPKSQALVWAERRNIAARMVHQDAVLVTPAGRAASNSTRFAASEPATKQKPKSTGAARWPKDWGMLVTFTAPPKQLVRDQHFRAPYMAMWISDLNNKSIRTLLLVGTHLDWQEDNYIWWSINGENVKHLAATRSMSTSGTGVYKMLWDGTDDDFKEVPAGTYVLHVETSRERGRHTHRSLTLDFSRGKPFTDEIPRSEEAGGVTVSFSHP